MRTVMGALHAGRDMQTRGTPLTSRDKIDVTDVEIGLSRYGIYILRL